MRKRRKLLFYVHALSGGGAERVMARLASGFAARGDETLLVVDFEASEWRGLLDDRVRIEVLPRGHARGLLALAKLLRRERPDACLSAMAASNLKLSLAAMLTGHCRRVFLSYHGFFENEPERLSRLGYLAAPILSRMTAASVCVSHALAKDLIRRLKVARRAVFTIYNPASPAKPQPPLTLAELKSRAPLILGIGRLVHDKGFMTLLRAFAHVEHPQARLAILGKGPDDEKIRSEAQRLGVADRIELPGYVIDPGAYLSRASCLVSPSYCETFGLVVVEALDHGLPVVSTMSGGPSEILNAPELGRLVPIGDEKAMAAAITEMLAEPGDPAPRQRRAADFTLDVALDEYDALFSH